MGFRGSVTTPTQTREYVAACMRASECVRAYVRASTTRAHLLPSSGYPSLAPQRGTLAQREPVSKQRADTRHGGPWHVRARHGARAGAAAQMRVGQRQWCGRTLSCVSLAPLPSLLALSWFSSLFLARAASALPRRLPLRLPLRLRLRSLEYCCREAWSTAAAAARVHSDCMAHTHGR